MKNKIVKKYKKYLFSLCIFGLSITPLHASIEICNRGFDRLGEVGTYLRRVFVRKQDECIEECHLLQSASSPLETVAPEIQAEINTRCDMCKKLEENQIIPPITKKTDVPPIARYKHLLKWQQALGLQFFDWNQQIRNPSLSAEEIQRKYTETCGPLNSAECCALYGGSKTTETACTQDSNMQVCFAWPACKNLPQKTPCDKDLQSWKSPLDIPADWQRASDKIDAFLIDHNSKTSDQSIVDFFEHYSYAVKSIDRLYETLDLLTKLENCKEIGEEVAPGELCCQGMPAPSKKTQKCTPLDQLTPDLKALRPQMLGMDKLGKNNFYYDNRNPTGFELGTYRVGYWILKETLEKMHGKNTLYKIIPAALPAVTNEMIPIPENTNFRLEDYQGGFVGIGRLFGTDKDAAQQANKPTTFTLFAYILKPGTSQVKEVKMYSGTIQPGVWTPS